MRSFRLIPALLLVALAACRPEIGDACVSDTECDRGQVCDTTSPGGYCIEYGCEPNDCPAEAVCVDFVEEGELLLSACMRRCNDNGQCPRGRDGYVCRRDIGPVPFCAVEPVSESTEPVDSEGSASGEGSAEAALDGSGG